MFGTPKVSDYCKNKYLIMNEERFPLVSKELIDALDAIYPNKCAGRNQSLDDIRYESGQRNVVDFLIDKFNEQADKLLSG